MAFVMKRKNTLKKYYFSSIEQTIYCKRYNDLLKHQLIEKVGLINGDYERYLLFNWSWMLSLFLLSNVSKRKSKKRRKRVIRGLTY